MEVKNQNNAETIIAGLVESKREALLIRVEDSRYHSLPDFLGGASAETIEVLRLKPSFKIKKLRKNGTFTNSGSSDGDGPFWEESFTTTAYYLTKC